MLPDEHIEKAEELMEQAEQNLAYYSSEAKVEKGHALATLALAHIQIAKAKAGL